MAEHITAEHIMAESKRVAVPQNRHLTFTARIKQQFKQDSTQPGTAAHQSSAQHVRGVPHVGRYLCSIREVRSAARHSAVQIKETAALGHLHMPAAHNAQKITNTLLKAMLQHLA
jgi:hypothetical protein